MRDFKELAAALIYMLTTPSGNFGVQKQFLAMTSFTTRLRNRRQQRQRMQAHVFSLNWENR